jgi:tetrahydromethanopterin S-methyltransferase subunit G
MAESLASLFASGTETYMLQRMSEVEKKMNALNADYLQLSWRFAETLDENAKLSARIAELERKVSEVDAEYLLTEVIDENTKLSARVAELERKIDVVDTEYVQVSSDRWLSVKDTKTLLFRSDAPMRPNMVCKLINLDKLTICNNSRPETLANKNVRHIDVNSEYLPTLGNFPSCKTLSINVNSNLLTAHTLISALSTQKHNINTLSVSSGCAPIMTEHATLVNYCKSNGITMVKYGSWN